MSFCFRYFCLCAFFGRNPIFTLPVVIDLLILKFPMNSSVDVDRWHHLVEASFQRQSGGKSPQRVLLCWHPSGWKLWALVACLWSFLSWFWHTVLLAKLLFLCSFCSDLLQLIWNKNYIHIHTGQDTVWYGLNNLLCMVHLFSGVCCPLGLSCPLQDVLL